MEDADQTQVPDSFVALFMQPGRLKPTAGRAHITARYEWCEDLASHLYEYARAQHFDLGIGEADVLERVHLGLLGGGSSASESSANPSSVDAAEATWVVRRLAELEGWDCPELPAPAPTQPPA